MVQAYSIIVVQPLSVGRLIFCFERMKIITDALVLFYADGAGYYS